VRVPLTAWRTYCVSKGLVLLRTWGYTFCDPRSFSQVLENEKLLIVLQDRRRIFIYLERRTEMNAAIQRVKPVKCLNREKLGEDILYAFDETNRTLVICASAKVP
jgi:hypothetical protein